MTRIARNSDTPATSWAAKSRPKVSRYWARARIEAVARRRYVIRVASRSSTLDHQLPNGRGQHQSAGEEKGRGPQSLEGERAEQVEALVLPQEDVDRDLDDTRERQGLEHPTWAVGQEVEWDQESGKERPGRGGHVQVPAIVEQPEGRQVDDEAKAEAEDGRQHR